MLYLTALSAALTAALVAYVLSLATPVSSRDFFAHGTAFWSNFTRLKYVGAR